MTPATRVELVLYTTCGCHLCEEAARLLDVLQLEAPVSVISVDIAADEALVDRYGIRIPVVRRPDTAQEIGWPFGLDELRGLLQTG